MIPEVQKLQSNPAGLMWRIGITQTAFFLSLFHTWITVVPKFEKIFKDFDAELPSVTIFVLRLNNWFISNWYLTVPVWLALLAACLALSKNGLPGTARVISGLFLIGVALLLALTAAGLYIPFAAVTHKLS